MPTFGKKQIPNIFWDKAGVTLSRIGGRTAPDQISWMVLGGPADLGHFVPSSDTSPDETRSSHGFYTRMMPVDTGTSRRKTHGMCRRTHGMTRSTHGSARMSHGSARKTPGTPRLSQDRNNQGIYPDVSNCFTHTGTNKAWAGTPRIYYGFATAIHGLPRIKPE